MPRERRPKALRIHSRDELKQILIQTRVSDSRLKVFIGDARERERLYRGLNGFDLVVQAATLKRVAVAEYNPLEAIKTNIEGAANVIAIPDAVGSSGFLLEARLPGHATGGLCPRAAAQGPARPDRIAGVRTLRGSTGHGFPDSRVTQQRLSAAPQVSAALQEHDDAEGGPVVPLVFEPRPRSTGHGYGEGTAVDPTPLEGVRPAIGGRPGPRDDGTRPQEPVKVRARPAEAG